MFPRKMSWLTIAIGAAVVGYFVKDKLPQSLQDIYTRIEEKLKKK